MATPRKKKGRRALSHTGGRSERRGQAEAARTLAHCLDVGKLDPDRLTHGFHSYPARMHWGVAERALSALAPEGGRVLDPFCGSGTVLIEARVQGFAAAGSDLNPLALRLSALKTAALGPRSRKHLLGHVQAIAEASEERVRARQPVQAQLPKSELQHYGPHILKEMAGLLEEIKAVEDPKQREALLMVFSSIVVKVSKQRGDTTEGPAEKRLRKGLPTEFFVRKAHELCERWSEYQPLAKGPAVKLYECDAREIGDRLRRRADLILSSPPYGGTYDYVAHHQRRFAWLRIRPTKFAAGEIGARRHGADPKRFDAELLDTLRAMQGVLSPRGQIALLMGDGQHGSRRVPADVQLEKLAPEAGLKFVASASQMRPDFAGHAPRREHLVLLRHA